MITPDTFTLLAIERVDATQKIMTEHFHGLHPMPTIIHAKTGQEAMAIFRQNKPDLLLLDLQLPPHGDGSIEVLNSVIKESPHTPVIMIAEETQQNEIIRALHLGACGCILSAPW
ncbi:response regulator [Thermodesulfobacteriota bacterium]